MIPSIISGPQACEAHEYTTRRIFNAVDVRFFLNESAACKNIKTFIDLLTDSIKGTGKDTLNRTYIIQNEVFKECASFIDILSDCCDRTSLDNLKTGTSLRFGHVAFRDWYEDMRKTSREFVDKISARTNKQYRDELFTYLLDSFGNKMRIDYGTGHELNFMIFTMGLCSLVMKPKSEADAGDSSSDLIVGKNELTSFVNSHSWDIHALFSHKYLRLCRKLQTKFRLEPAGSRGVYNIDDFQFLPFLFGASQLSGNRQIPASDFYHQETVNQYKDDYIFFEAVDFILSNKRGPFEEHSYTLWTYTNTGSWDKICRIIRNKFNDEVLSPFPIIQHLQFGEFILRWT